MARPKKQAERRHGLRRAASRAIATRGYTEVRIKDVAAEAGLSSQAVLYYYPDVNALLMEAISHAVTRYVESRRKAVDALDESVAQLAATIRAGFSDDPEDDTAVIFQCVGAVRHDAVVRAMLQSLTEQQVELYRRVLEVGASRGDFRLAGDSRTIATNIVALEDAYGLYIVEGSPLTVVEAVERVAAYASLATGAQIEPFASDAAVPASA